MHIYIHECIRVYVYIYVSENVYQVSYKRNDKINRPLHCNTPRHSATCCNPLQHTIIHSREHSATHCY